MGDKLLKFDDAGLRNVWLANGYEIRKTRYGPAVSIRNVEGLAKAICASLTREPGKLTGAEARYLRLNLGLSQEALGKLMGVSGQTVALWEKRGKLPLLSDKYLRLLWIERHNGNDSIVRVMQRIQDVERLVHQKIVLRETPGRRWTATTSTVDEAPA